MTDGEGLYSLPALTYGYGELSPFISEQLLRVHHDGHHKRYVDQANAILERLDKARVDGVMLDTRCEARALAFNVGGHFLHSLYWENMRPASSGGGGTPGGRLGDILEQEFGSFDRFQREFTELASSVESSGWATLVWSSQNKRPLLVQVKDHDLHVIPGSKVLMVLDMWEHAYYLDYMNEKAKYAANFWNVVDWDIVDERLGKVLGGKRPGSAAQVPAVGGMP